MAKLPEYFHFRVLEGRTKIGIQDVSDRDFVEVVRCKDCKYSEHWYRDKRLCRLWYGEEKQAAPIDVFDDGFCNYGERREDDD